MFRRTEKKHFKVVLSGPSIETTEFVFDFNEGATVNLHTDFIDCDNGDTCTEKTPGTIVFEVIPIV